MERHKIELAEVASGKNFAGIAYCGKEVFHDLQTAPSGKHVPYKATVEDWKQITCATCRKRHAAKFPGAH